ncbi:MAG: pentapeptide repeat-containing protein [Xenococcaceae cyanobacterium MO_167.B27]|nr:pentapeptide repeat-containing protein [Xenococcaceae cyanobacterium MO_167.B27]
MNTNLLNFSGQNLQGKSFKEQNLIGADFRGANICSTDFTGANLTNADFSDAVAGLDRKSTIIVFLISIFISMTAGAMAGLGGQFIQRLFEQSQYTSLAITISNILLAIFLLVTFWKGLGTAIKSLVSKIVFSSLLLGVLAIVTGVGNGVGAIGVIFCLVFLTIVTIGATVARACGGTMSNILFFLVAISGVLAGRTFSGGLGATAIAISSVLISKRALSGDIRDRFILRLSLAISAYFGTSFRKSNLTNANFTNARLINADFRQATLTDSCREKLQNLHLVIN